MPLIRMQPADFKPPRRSFLSVEGLPKVGKTHFALTAPDPIAFLNVDQGLEGTVSGFADKQIDKADYGSAFGLDLAGERLKKDVQEAARAVYLQFEQDYLAALAGPYQTVVVDKATEVWRYLRVAEFGKVSKVPSHLYNHVNATYRRLMIKALDTTKNVILVHDLEEEWEEYVDTDGRSKRRWTGRYQLNGFKETASMVQTGVRLDGMPPNSTVQVLNSRQNIGLVEYGPMPGVGFPELLDMLLG